MIKRKGNKLYVKWKWYDNSFNSWIDKNYIEWNFLYKKSQYFPKPYEPFDGDINVKVDLSNYATKADFKNATGIDTSKLATKSDLASLRAEVDKLDIEKLIPIPVDLNKLSDVVKMMLLKELCMISMIILMLVDLF